MSGSENGGGGGEEQLQSVMASPTGAPGLRSASPAKRSAADMEHNAERASSGFAKEEEGIATDFDEAMADVTSVDGTQDTIVDTIDTSARTSNVTDSYATSFQSEGPPPYSDEEGSRGQSSTSYTTEEIDEQERKVRQLQNKPLDEGQKGIVVSSAWLARVLSRSSEGQKRSEFPKEAMQGEIGPVDNASIVPHGAFDRPFLHDGEGRDYIPLRPGLIFGADFEVFNDEAWGFIVGAYGIKNGQRQIDRYVRNTAPSDAEQSNLQWDNYPPIFTVRKVPQTNQDQEASALSLDALSKLRLKKEQQSRGQDSPDDAVLLVSSRAERFQRFLARSKRAAGIPQGTKVKVWKLIHAPKEPTDTARGEDNRLTPPMSRSGSPVPGAMQKEKLVLAPSVFKGMELGKDIEPIDARDETDNSKYNGTSTMNTFNLFEDQTLLLEEQIGGPGGGEFASDLTKRPKISIKRPGIGSKPTSITPSGRTSPAPGGGLMTRGRQRRDGRTRGVVGLQNLGNTCYMNSALQCIRSVEELAIYFLSESYKKDINNDNPLGYHGAMANQYAKVLQGIYSDSATSAFNPSAFKNALGRHQPLFSGYGQQDSQEFLSFLVDALHEDLNRILKKPYTENPDSDDGKVHDKEYIVELGKTYRANHRARNDSVAMDLFNGFYKNTMECPNCGKISITFDPYSLVTLQLPIENTLQHTFTFVPLHGEPVNHDLDMDKSNTIWSIKEYVASRHHNLDPKRLWMVEVYNHKIYKVFEDTTTLAEAGIQTADFVFIFELDEIPSNALTPAEKRLFYSSYTLNRETIPSMDDARADCISVPVFSRQKNRMNSGWDVVLHPVYITVTRDEAKDYDTILKKVLVAVARLTSRPLLTENVDNSVVDSATMSETEKDESPAEENGQVSDRSVPSEDGYVEVSTRSPTGLKTPDVETNGAAGAAKPVAHRLIPQGFMDAQFYLSPALRNQLFSMNYAPSESGMYCAGASGFQDRAVRNVFDRVKLPSRRSSVNSSTSSRADSAASTGSEPRASVESDESDTDVADMDKPDITLGGVESHLSMPSDDMDQESDNESPPDLAARFKDNRRQQRGRNRRGKQKTYSRKDRQNARMHRLNGAPSMNVSRQYSPKIVEEDDDNPYYIKIGEGIVLDWYPEAFANLFGGKPKDENDQRGHFTSSVDRKGLITASDPVVRARKERRQQRAREGVTLDDCFEETGKREVLSEDNAWYCNRCKELRRATKTLEIWTIPDILVVHLKRFGGNRSFRDKLDAKVDYPVEGLDMTKRVGMKDDGKEYIYDLFAVDNHYGGLGGGHYTAYAKSFYDGQWYDYNDSSATKLGDAPKLSAAAYLLFYRRRSDKPLGPQSLQNLVTEFRDPVPKLDEPNADETAEESDSGEGRLGGPNGSLHGSPSALTGAGAAAAATLGPEPIGGLAGAELPAGSSPMMREVAMTRANDSDDWRTQPVVHHAEYGDQGSTEWGFDTLDGDAVPESDVLMGEARGDDDAASTLAEAEVNDDERMHDSWDEGSEWNAAHQNSSSNNNTPARSPQHWQNDSQYDDHTLYSDAHDRQDRLHLEDAGIHGAEEEDDDVAVPLYLDPPTPPQEQME